MEELPAYPPVDASHAWRFTRSAIEGLLSKIRSRVVRVIPRRIRKLNFRATIKKIGYIGLKSDHLVQSILDGKVNPWDMGKNISSLKFVHEDISRYVEEQKRTLRGDNIPIREAALRLGLITEKEIIKFQSTYILATAIAAMHGTSSGQITNLLMRDGISPVSGRRVDDGRQYIFRKADLENVDVTELVLTAKRNRCLRSTKKLSTINLTRAAKMLGVSAKTVHKIAENGVLRTYTSGDPGTEDELRFSMFAVNRLRNHNIDYTNLISISAASKIFGQPHIKFSKDWIQSGCLEVKCRIDKQYLLLDDVQAFARLRKKTATPGEAAKLLGVGTRAIICHMNAGRLKLAAGSAKKREGKLFLRSDVERLYKATSKLKATHC
jgi:DNA-binding protein Fis